MKHESSHRQRDDRLTAYCDANHMIATPQFVVKRAEAFIFQDEPADHQ